MSEQERFRRRMQELFARPDRWESIGADALKQLAFYECLRFGATGDLTMVPSLGKLYEVVARRTGERDRLSLLAQVARSLHTNVGGIDALMPFIFGDPDLSVVAAASMDLALLVPLADGDPMTGPRTLRRMADRAEDEGVRLGMLCGLVSLGDRRTLPLLEGCWRTVGGERRRALGGFWPGCAFASTIEFLVGWMEEADGEDDFEAVAAALAAMPGRAGSSGVIDVERSLPMNAAGDRPPITVLGEWSAGEYGRLIAPRLVALLERDPGRRAVPAVLAAWGTGG